MVKRIFVYAGLALAAFAALPARAVAFVAEFLTPFVDRAAHELSMAVGQPALAGEGEGGVGFVEPSLLNRNRHEAGLARLGTARHI